MEGDAMRTWVKILIVIAVVLALLAVSGYLFAGNMIYSRLSNVKGSCDEWLANRPDNFALHPEWPAFDVSQYYMPGWKAVRFPSRDPGIEIAGYWIERTPGGPTVIYVHGMGGCKSALEVLAPAGMLARNAINVLLIDLRDVGDSTFEDGRAAIGNEEYLDVLGAFDWLTGEKGYAPERVGLAANSLGGASAIYAFSEEPRIPALFVQSTFGNLREILAAELERNGYPTLLVPATILAGRLFGGDDLVAHTPTTAMAKAAGRPVFIVHSRDDQRIDYHQAEQLAEAARAGGAEVDFWLVDDVGHVRTPGAYPEEFERRMVGFFQETLGGSP
jgi:pimeloyl-ACP methyl ester carboxylesterase